MPPVCSTALRARRSGTQPASAVHSPLLPRCWAWPSACWISRWTTWHSAKQFDKVIGSFQAVQHHLSDIVTKIEFAKPVLYRAFYALQLVNPIWPCVSRTPSFSAAEASWFAAANSLQVHGAMGYTWEVDLQMFMKRAWVLDAAWGDKAYHAARLTQGLLRSPNAPVGPGSTLIENRFMCLLLCARCY